ncbi:hypothetical protein ACHQM5_016605 [Ranunculus cassubicifolius]
MDVGLGQPRATFIFIIVLLLFHAESSGVLSAPMVPALFVMGDSLVDNGNNNYLNSLAKANYMPYGIDFTGWPTGRFTNGRTVADFLGEKMGLPYLPPYAAPSTAGSRILNGVNYASAAAGILDETGQHYGERFSLTQQVLNFENTLRQLRNLIGNVDQYLAKSIVFMVFGSNDYINNYLMPNLYPTSNYYTPQNFAYLLLNHYARQLVALYSVGLRKFLIAGVGPLGCIPNQRGNQPPPYTCISRTNEMLGTLNEGLRTLVTVLNANHTDAKFVYANTYAGVGDILNHQAAYGFSVWNRGCCGIQGSDAITCLPFSNPCTSRSQYVFWDAFHTTQSTNAVLAERAFSGGPNDCYPMNLRQLIAW